MTDAKTARQGRQAAPLRPMKEVNLERVFILPTIILLILTNIFPLIWSLFLSFSDYSAKLPTEWGKNPLMV